MRRFFLGLLLCVGALLVLPPLWFAVSPAQVYELPAPGRRIAVGDGLFVNAVDHGSGPPVVLVHGLPGTGYDWAPLTEALAARGHRVLAYDRVGYGRSDPRPDADFSVRANSSELLGLLQSEDLRDATVAGWSYGGPVSIVAAQMDAARIGRLVLVGSGGPSSDEDEGPPEGEFGSVLFSGPVLAWMKWVPPVARGLRAMLSEQAFSEGPQPEWWLPQLHANLDNPTSLAAWKSEIEGIFGSVQEPLGLENLDLPILLFHGDDDRLAPIAIGHYLHGKSPTSELVVIEGGSHMLPITHADLLADRIATFAGAGS